MAGERYRHIFLNGPTSTARFRSPRKGRAKLRIRERDRAQHAARLQRQLQEAWDTVDADRRAVAHIERQGAYLEFESDPGFDLVIKSLDARRSGIRLLNVRRLGPEAAQRTLATVYVPNSGRQYFLRKIAAYEREVDARSGEPKNAKLINSIADIRKTVLTSFWTDGEDLLPAQDSVWVEIWLSSEHVEVIDRFREILIRQQIEHADDLLKFPERAVLLALANRPQLERLIEESDDIAELRLAKEPASFVLALGNREQLERVRELLGRTRFGGDGSVVVTILDTGVNNGHLLIEPLLAAADIHAADSAWGGADHDGHGTLMAGTVAYGDLLAVLNSGAPVHVPHRLESAKILPPHGHNPHRLWGDITARGLHRAELQAPGRMRIACMAIAATDSRDRGRPSSWSGMIDVLASGRDDDTPRLIILCAGNTSGAVEYRIYPESNKTSEIHDPGQAWNALTVGAYTEKTRFVDVGFRDYVAIAPKGGLSPHSTTSLTWSKWPVKPDVVFEGGNIARGPNDSIQTPRDLQLLSTNHNHAEAQFAEFDGTSAASAQAAWMAAQIQSRYPEAWPETIRALIVHTADWTDAMRKQFLPENPAKGDYAKLLRTCGWGVPSLERALFCASNSLTLISQTALQPYDQVGGTRSTRDMHLYELPWPRAELMRLAEAEVQMRVTLSYFVEPGPGEIGWQDRYRYPSHGLRFALNGPGEDQQIFVKRINRLARDEGERGGQGGPREQWLIGDNGRNQGSIHSDIWLGRAADLAASNLVGIYPSVGWWRERHHLGRVTRRCRYSLVVSIEPPEQEVDIYTPVAIAVGIAAPVVIRV